MKRIICWLVAIILAVTAVFSCVSFAFAAEGPAELSLVFENCDPPEAGDLYAAEEDTTVRVADTCLLYTSFWKSAGYLRKYPMNRLQVFMKRSKVFG